MPCPACGMEIPQGSMNAHLRVCEANTGGGGGTAADIASGGPTSSVKPNNRPKGPMEIAPVGPDGLVPCAVCGRTFNPERIAKHQFSCTAKPIGAGARHAPTPARSAPIPTQATTPARPASAARPGSGSRPASANRPGSGSRPASAARTQASRSPPTRSPAGGSGSAAAQALRASAATADRLRELDELQQAGLLSEAEYTAKRAQILSEAKADLKAASAAAPPPKRPPDQWPEPRPFGGASPPVTPPEAHQLNQPKPPSAGPKKVCRPAARSVCACPLSVRRRARVARCPCRRPSVGPAATPTCRACCR